MSVNLVTTLASLYAAHNAIELEFSQNDIGSGDIKIHFISQPEDGSGNNYEPYPEIFKTPSASETFKRDLSRVAKSIVSTRVPENSAVPVNDSYIIKPMKLNFGYITFDGSVTPCTTISTMAQQTDLFYVLNSALMSENITALTLLAAAGNGLLHQRPPIWFLAKGQMDWLWHFGEGTVELYYYDKSGGLLDNEIHNFDNTNAFKVNIVSIDPFVYNVSGEVHRILIYIKNASSVIIETYNVYYRCELEGIYTGVTFLEPLGGRAPMSTGGIFKGELARSADDIYKAFNPALNLHTMGGPSAINVVGKRRRTFKTQLEYVNDKYTYLRYIESFFSSPGHHIQFGSRNTAKIEKCILESGSYQTYVEYNIIEVEFTVVMSEEKNNQNEDQ